MAQIICANNITFLILIITGKNLFSIFNRKHFYENSTKIIRFFFIISIKHFVNR